MTIRITGVSFAIADDDPGRYGNTTYPSKSRFVSLTTIGQNVMTNIPRFPGWNPFMVVQNGQGYEVRWSNIADA
jgi:hypothetical protein